MPAILKIPLSSEFLEFFRGTGLSLNFFLHSLWLKTDSEQKIIPVNLKKKSIVKKLQIGSNIIFLMGMKIIHICNFLTMKFYEKLHKCFFVQNQFLIIKNEGKNSKITRYLWKIPRTRMSMQFSRWLLSAILKKKIVFYDYKLILNKKVFL